MYCLGVGYDLFHRQQQLTMRHRGSTRKHSGCLSARSVFSNEVDAVDDIHISILQAHLGCSRVWHHPTLNVVFETQEDRMLIQKLLVQHCRTLRLLLL